MSLSEKKGDGKSAFIGDSSPVEDITPKYRNEEHGGVKRTYDGFIDRDNGPLLVNVVNWLAEQENYQTFADIDLPLDEPSPILDMETPELSTEPQVEPWRAPQSGYLWYDQSTFADGSYGSETAPPVDIKYSIDTPGTLPADGTPFQVKITLTDMNPNQVITNAQMQVYLQGGTAVSQIQQADGSWPNGYGYQSTGEIRADASGTAETTVTMRLGNGVIEGSANIRLRVGSTNVVTQGVTIGNDAGGEQPQPPVEEAEYNLVYPDALPIGGTVFPVEVILNGLEPGTTITNAQVQVYLTGGQAVSQIQREDGTWPSNYGYFNVGNLTANQEGRASKTIQMRLNPTTQAGTASIRLRLGSGNNVLTESVSLQAINQTSSTVLPFRNYLKLLDKETFWKAS